jgi:hypothetical protein
MLEAQAKHSAISKPEPAVPPIVGSMKIGGHVEVEVSIGAGESDNWCTRLRDGLDRWV